MTPEEKKWMEEALDTAFAGNADPAPVDQPQQMVVNLSVDDVTTLYTMLKSAVMYGDAMDVMIDAEGFKVKIWNNWTPAIGTVTK